MKEKYFLTEPVPNGNAWWSIRVPEKKLPNGEIQANFIVADFSIHLPNAEKEARSLLERLNK